MITQPAQMDSIPQVSTAQRIIYTTLAEILPGLRVTLGATKLMQEEWHAGKMDATIAAALTSESMIDGYSPVHIALWGVAFNMIMEFIEKPQTIDIGGVQIETTLKDIVLTSYTKMAGPASLPFVNLPGQLVQPVKE